MAKQVIVYLDEQELQLLEEAVEMFTDTYQHMDPDAQFSEAFLTTQFNNGVRMNNRIRDLLVVVRH